MSIELTSEGVVRLMRECLHTEGEDASGAVIVDGIVCQFGFKPERINANRENIRSLLAQLPDEFMADKGGGMSFLNACVDRNGNQWGEHVDMEALFSLGVAAGLARCLFPRKLWSILPCGMPYYAVDLKALLPDEERERGEA